VVQALKIELLCLNSIIYNVQGHQADNIGAFWRSGEERNACLPPCSVGPQLVEEVECLGFESLVGRWVPGYFDGIFDLLYSKEVSPGLQAVRTSLVHNKPPR